MPIPNPRTPYERAYNDWVYGGGADRGEPMPRARDFSSSDQDNARQREAPDGARRDGIWQGPQAPYQGPPMDDAIGTYDPRTSPPPPAGGYQGPGSFHPYQGPPIDAPPDQGPIGQPPWMRETDRRRDLPTGGQRYTSQEKRAIQAQNPYLREQEQRRSGIWGGPQTPYMAPGQRRRRPQDQYGRTSLGALNRR